PHETDSRLWMGGPGGALTEEAEVRLAGIDLTDAVGGTAVDVEGDGDLDLYVTRWRRPNALLRNDGAGRFADVTAVSGLDRYSWRSQSSSWADVDGDGDLDLFSGSYGPDLKELGDYSFDDQGIPPSEDDSQLWLNDGDGTFTDASDLLPPVVQDGWTFMSSWLDVDLDGFPELFVWHDFGSSHPSAVLHNDGGVGFTFEPGQSGIDRAFEDMGVAIGDVDGDGLPDFAMTSYKKVNLMLARPVSTYVGAAWVEAAAAWGLAVDTTTWDQFYGWGAELGDLDNDRDEDLTLLFGGWSTYDNVAESRTERDGVWLQDDDADTFENVAADPGWNLDDDGIGRGLVVADVTGDGFLDILKRQLDGPALRYESRCDDTAWIRVELREPTRNPRAIGAKIRAISPDGHAQTRWITAGSTSLYSGGPAEAHFGLGTDEAVDLEVTWPDGGSSRVTDVPVRRVVTITRR
ncbi:MAG: CRTAC1 family protein, partial [Myxococcota bacterium]